MTSAKMDGALMFWTALFLVQMSAAAYLLWRRRNYWVAIGALAVAILVPVVAMVIDCMNGRTSEACVWGQALLPFYAGLMLLVVAPLLYLLSTALIVGLRRLFAGGKA